MKRILTILALAATVASTATAQTSSPAEMTNLPAQQLAQQAPQQTTPKIKTLDEIRKETSGEAKSSTFSKIGFSAGLGFLGANAQAATNLTRFLNVRGVANIFNYSIDNISTNGFNVGGKLNVLNAGVSADFYPFPKHGFRLSPGALIYNDNEVTMSGTIQSSTSIDLNDTTFYSSTSNPLKATGNLNLHKQKQAFTMTTGWGNMLANRSRHWSIPFEIGAAFTGAPTMALDLTGTVCTTYQQTVTTCADLASTNPTADQAQIINSLKSNLATQLATWNKDLDKVRVYPILSVGFSYNFNIR